MSGRTFVEGLRSTLRSRSEPIEVREGIWRLDGTEAYN